MRTSRLFLGLIVCLLLSPAMAVAGEATFTSPREALKQGISAYQGGYYELALPALEFAAKKGEFLGEYYLARVYSDNSTAYTDHAKAYELYERIVDQHIDADPDDDPRAVYVGRSLTALAGYVKRGLPEASVKPDPERAVFLLKNASTTFNDEDAQFELAKLQIKGEGVEANVPLGRHWLSILSQNGHAGAQAFFADLLWRGKHVDPDPARALALISIAVDNAPQQDRLWIEDIYQNIYCGAGEGIRKQATGIVAEWGNRFGRKPQDARDRTATGLASLAPAPVRTCQNGEAIGTLGQRSGAVAQQSTVARDSGMAPKARPAGFTYGTAAGAPASGLRDVGVTVPAGDPQNR